MAFIHYTAHARPSPLGIVGADSIMGCTVVDRQGLRIGELRDVMLDLSTGRIAYAVIASVSRSKSEQLICVPWNAIRPDYGSQRLCINADVDWIERAPSVRGGHTPDQFVQDWGAFIHNYFGTRPYWEAASAPQYS